MDDARFLRTAGLCCVAGGIIAAVGAMISASIPSAVPLDQLSSPFTPTVFVATEITWTIAHVLMLIGTLGFGRSGAVGDSRLGRSGLGIAIVGMTLIVPSELGFAFFGTELESSIPAMLLSTAIGLATMVAALGFVLAGIAVLRAGRWGGWQRPLPLLCGAAVFVTFLPVMAIAPDFFLWPVALWSATFVPLGMAVYRQGDEAAGRALSAVTA